MICLCVVYHFYFLIQWVAETIENTLNIPWIFKLICVISSWCSVQRCNSEQLSSDSVGALETSFSSASEYVYDIFWLSSEKEKQRKSYSYLQKCSSIQLIIALFRPMLCNCIFQKQLRKRDIEIDSEIVIIIIIILTMISHKFYEEKCGNFVADTDDIGYIRSIFYCRLVIYNKQSMKNSNYYSGAWIFACVVLFIHKWNIFVMRIATQWRHLSSKF